MCIYECFQCLTTVQCSSLAGISVFICTSTCIQVFLLPLPHYHCDYHICCCCCRRCHYCYCYYYYLALMFFWRCSSFQKLDWLRAIIKYYKHLKSFYRVKDSVTVHRSFNRSRLTARDVATTHSHITCYFCETHFFCLTLLRQTVEQQATNRYTQQKLQIHRSIKEKLRN